tara:strand:- start:1003 stop:1179 length:177 start_codon:yes stop_codon:yes gene_type:complete
MIEIILWWSLLGPMLLISIAYLLIMGWSNPRKIVTVYSEDTNRIDENGGPYEVEIESD